MLASEGRRARRAKCKVPLQLTLRYRPWGSPPRHSNCQPARHGQPLSNRGHTGSHQSGIGPISSKFTEDQLQIARPSRSERTYGGQALNQLAKVWSIRWEQHSPGITEKPCQDIITKRRYCSKQSRVIRTGAVLGHQSNHVICSCHGPSLHMSRNYPFPVVDSR
jgi:hypothetical protein